MKKFLFVIVVAGVLPAYGQCFLKKVKWGVEAGMIASGMPRNSSYVTLAKVSLFKYAPGITPFFGINGSYKLNRIMGMSVGAQYFKTGESITQAASGLDDGCWGTYESFSYRYYHNVSFNSLSFPLLFSFKPLGDRWPALTVGMRTNYLVSGQEEWDIRSEYADPSSNTYKKGTYNIFQDYELAPKRIQLQLMLGATYRLSRRMHLALNYSRGNDLKYAQIKPGENRQDGVFYNQTVNTLSLGLKYNLSKCGKHQCCKKPNSPL